MTDKEYLTAVYAFSYFGPARVKLLLSYFRSAKKIWGSASRELIKTGLPAEKVAQFTSFRENFNLKDYFKKLGDLKINVVVSTDKEYPQNLSGLNGSPLVLYYKGKLSKKDVNSVAVIGSRKMSLYGREVAEKFSSELAANGVVVISGLARGVDTVAHQSALKNGGRTIAVLGNSLDSIYPPENRLLSEEIVKSGGALISELPLGSATLPANFPIRNRIVSGMSLAVLVIEGAEKSGTLLTAAHAAEQGKTVFAVPGQITTPQSFVPLLLLRNGARIAVSTNDILEELGV